MKKNASLGILKGKILVIIYLVGFFWGYQSGISKVVAAGMLPDLTGEGRVDLFDYNLLVTQFGNPYTVFDYNLLVSRYGQITLTPTSSPRQGPTPVPTTPAVGKIEKWVHPNFNTIFRHNDAGPEWGNYLRDEMALAELMQNYDVFGVFGGMMGEGKNEFLTSLGPNLKKLNKKLAIETQGFHTDNCSAFGKNPVPCNCTTDGMTGKKVAILQAQRHVGLIEKMAQKGATLDYFRIDDPLLHMLLPGAEVKACQFETYQEAIDNGLIPYLKEVHKKYPNLKFGMNFNLPHWTYGSYPALTRTPNQTRDLQPIIAYLAKQLPKAGEKIWFIHMDNPYDFTGYDKTGADKNLGFKRLQAAEKQIESFGISFGILFNSEDGGRGAQSSDQRFHTDTLNYIRQYYTNWGTPKNMIIESWYKHPMELYPASKNYTFSNTAVKAIQVLNQVVK